jgi:hypothetical protein
VSEAASDLIGTCSGADLLRLPDFVPPRVRWDTWIHAGSLAGRWSPGRSWSGRTSMTRVSDLVALLPVGPISSTGRLLRSSQPLLADRSRRPSHLPSFPGHRTSTLRFSLLASRSRLSRSSMCPSPHVPRLASRTSPRLLAALDARPHATHIDSARFLLLHRSRGDPVSGHPSFVRP